MKKQVLNVGTLAACCIPQEGNILSYHTVTGREYGREIGHNVSIRTKSRLCIETILD